MAQRTISREEVRLTVNNPDYTRPGDFGATNYYRELSGRTLRVTLGGDVFGGARRVVITVALGKR
jgi:hypothetical protein